jgi:hypothetical protein
MYTNVCKHCHKVFKAKIQTTCCKECRDLEESQLDDIVAYLREYPHSNALQIAEELGIHPYEIVKYMEEGWLNPVKGSFEKLP